MTDIKTALSGILSEWELDNKQPQENQVQKAPHVPHFKVTNNVTRDTYYFIRDNPDCSRQDVYAAMLSKGHKIDSVGSLLTQFVKKGMCVRTNMNNYRALFQEYKPMKAPKKVSKEREAAKAAAAKAAAARAQVNAMLQAKAYPQETKRESIATAWDADTIINNIGLKQARALYDELKKIFGG